MIKTPTVQEANCDPMVFQCYCSTAVALVSLLVWAVGCAEVPSFEVVDSGSVACGALFAVVWVSSQVLCVKGIQAPRGLARLVGLSNKGALSASMAIAGSRRR